MSMFIIDFLALFPLWLTSIVRGISGLSTSGKKDRIILAIGGRNGYTFYTDNSNIVIYFTFLN